MRSSEEMKQMYANVFGSMEGRIVLGDIVDTLCHVFDTIHPDAIDRIAERNVGLTILQTAGALGPLYTHLGIQKENQDGGSDSSQL